VSESVNLASTNTDHCYFSPCTQVMDEHLNLINSTIPKQGIKRKFSTQRLDHTINATEQLVCEMREKNAINREYYNKNLSYMEISISG
jgi:hypothetical protein